MTTAALDVAAAAAELHDARLARWSVPTLTSRWPDMTLVDAYAVQAAGIGHRLAAGERVIGGKLGFTSEAMRTAMGVTEPNYGWLTDAMWLHGDAGACRGTGTVELDRFIHPKVEPEIAFVLGRELSGQVTVAEVLDATEAVAACLEVVDSRYDGFRFAPLDNVADNSSAGALLLGERIGVDGLDLQGLGVTVTTGREVHAVATGAAAHGHPAAAVAWMVGACGQPLPAGSVVISGGLTSPVDLHHGVRVSATFDHLGTVTVHAR